METDAVGCVLYAVVRGGRSEELALGQRRAGGKGVSHAHAKGTAWPAGATASAKAPRSLFGECEE